MRARLIIIGLVLVLFAQFGAWFFDNYNRVTRDLYVGYRGEARYNDFLAAQRLTEALGLEADSQAGLSPGDWLPPLDDTVVLADNHRTLSYDDIDQLLRWVGAGGNLVAAPLRSGDETVNLLFDELEVAVVNANERAQETQDDGCVEPCTTAPGTESQGTESQGAESSGTDSPGTADEQQATKDNPFPKLRRSTVVVDGRAVHIDRRQPRLHVESFDVLGSGGDELGEFYVRLAYGQGQITLLADTLFSTNRLIGDEDNAAMLVNVIEYSGGIGKIWFIYGDSYPGIPALIWKHAPIAVVACALVLAFFLWRVSRRFGPMLVRPPPGSRSVLEHIRSTGSLLWTTNNPERLAEAARGRVLLTLERQHPGISHSNRDEQVQLIADHTGKPVDEVSALFNSGTAANPGEFTQQIVALQRLWKAL
ncbi:MAG: DUF4350 domain-containing protein [Pseudomonadota bacterium]